MPTAYDTSGQTPEAHDPELQLRAHAAQLALSVWRFASQPLVPMPSQSAWGAMHCCAQCPAMHVSASLVPGSGHGVSHAPQWATSVCVSTQSVPHVSSAHVHTLLEHCRPWAHSKLQVPQFLSSLVRSVQNDAPLVPHAICPLAHDSQVDDAHRAFSAHVLPHVPQLSRSDVGSTQVWSQNKRGSEHAPPSNV